MGVVNGDVTFPYLSQNSIPPRFGPKNGSRMSRRVGKAPGRNFGGAGGGHLKWEFGSDLKFQHLPQKGKSLLGWTEIQQLGIKLGRACAGLKERIWCLGS